MAAARHQALNTITRHIIRRLGDDYIGRMRWQSHIPSDLPCARVGTDGAFDLVRGWIFMESIQTTGLNSALEILELTARTPLQFSKPGPVIRYLAWWSCIYPGGVVSLIPSSS
jgi:hypothetical protein